MGVNVVQEAKIGKYKADRFHLHPSYCRGERWKGSTISLTIYGKPFGVKNDFRSSKHYPDRAGHANSAPQFDIAPQFDSVLRSFRRLRLLYFASAHARRW